MTDTQNTTQMTVTTTIPYSIDSGQYYPFYSNSDQSQPLIEDVNEHKVTQRISVESGNATTVVLKNEFTLLNDEHKNKNIKKEFDDLVMTWIGDIKYKSLESQQIKHPAFLRIIAKGKDVLPYIFEEFSKRPFVAWFSALEAITGKNVATNAESFSEAVQLWLEWGKQKGYFKK